MSKEYEDWLSGKILTSCEEFECAQAFEAGQQSQQAKIDDLQKENYRLNTWYKNVKLQFENKQIDCDRSDRKVDELSRRVESNLEINKNLQNMLDELIDERDGLQARVDEALKQLDLAYPESWGYCVDQAIDILKGNKDEN